MADQTPGSNMADKQLRSIIDRIERLNDQKQEISDEIKEVFAEAKSAGYDVKAIRRVMSLARLSKADRDMVELYADKLGVFG